MDYSQKIKAVSADIKRLGFDCVVGHGFTLIATGSASEAIRVEALAIKLASLEYRLKSYNEYHTGTESAEMEFKGIGVEIFVRLYNIGDSGKVRVVVI